ncbi:hypothetical protein BC835DRAFT_1385781 [Cytidiella melzeri]|nr:hypothetical protein BC835DRAFT_1385781 [Cytidiella melzeri]
MATRRRIVYTLLFLAYPFLAVGVATITCALGLFAAAWLSHDRVAQIGGVFPLLIVDLPVHPGSDGRTVAGKRETR